MNKKFMEFSKGITKECVVVLERLDKKLLSQYLKKYDSNTTELAGFVNNAIKESERNDIYYNDYSTTHKYSKENADRKPEKSTTKIKFKRGKRKSKPLRFRVNEFPNETNEIDIFWQKKEIISESMKNLKSACFKERNDGIIKKTENSEKTSGSLKIREVRCLKRCKPSRSLLNWKNSLKFEGGCTETTLKNIPCSNHSETDNSKDVHIDIEGGKEITTHQYSKKEKLPKSSSENLCFNTEQNFEEDEYDSREDGEDDRNTIIFGESSRKETDLEVFGLYAGGVDYAINKLKNKEVTDSKKAKLIKLKKKGLERNLETVRKPEIRAVLSPKVEEVTKEVVSYYIGENYLKEVCGLIKRLHELNRIISQLQKELPKNDELAIHFSKVIRVQEENFLEEIRKSQKTIIECYEKLLLFFDNSANEVFSEISQRALLGTEDVTNIIYRCFLLNEVYEKEKNSKASPEKQEKRNYFLQSKASDNLSRQINENLIRRLARRRVYNDIHLAPQSHLYFPSEGVSYEHELIHRPSDEPTIPELTPAIKNAMGSFHSSCGNFFPSHDDYQRQKQTSTNQENQNQTMNSQLRQPSQQDLNQRCPSHVPCFSDSLTCYNQSSILKTEHSHSQYNDFPVNSTVNHSQPEKPDPESSGSESSELGNLRYPSSFQYFYLPDHIEQKLSLNQFSDLECQMELLNSGSPTVQNKSSYKAVLRQNNLKRSGFSHSSKVHNRVIDPRKQVLTCLGEGKHPSGYYLNDSVRWSNQKRPSEKSHALFVSEREMCEKKQCSIQMKSRAEFENTSSRVAQEVLDPTIPQKLTMKNCRLQAGSTLKLETDVEVLEAAQKLNLLQSFKEKMDCSGLRKDESKSRVYVCAQNGCKMPGLRICKGCQSVIYCGETCQLKHWVLKHKKECYQLRELRGA